MQLHFVSLVSYATQAEVLKVLSEKSERYVYAATIQHDADTITKTDIDDWTRTHAKAEMCPWMVGQAKPVHQHILLGFEQERKYTEIRNWFKKATQEDGSVANTLAQGCNDPAGYYLYMTHETEQAIREQKHQYLDEDIKVLKGESIDLPSAKQSKQEQKEDENEALLEDILQHKPRREMVRKYGRDYMKNWKQYEEFAQMVKLEETGEIDLKLGKNPCIDETATHYFEMGMTMAINAACERYVPTSKQTPQYLEEKSELVKMVKARMNRD